MTSCLNFFSSICPLVYNPFLPSISPLTLEKAAEVAESSHGGDANCGKVPVQFPQTKIPLKKNFLTSHHKPPRPDQEIKHSVVHYIETNSRPVTAKARRLAPDRLPHRKAEFENMITLGRMRPSKSNYASPSTYGS
ncbi:hypothetical protein TNCV_275011 [Trichonephila clavipes]|nr:hypothetical protein TNCV_275011 [Trichonephila clavipes]